MNIGITGASGFIGQALVKLANERGHRVIGYSRQPDHPVPGCAETRAFRMDQTVDVTGCGAIVHLAGESVFGLWTDAKRARIRSSREIGTCHLVSAIRVSGEKPALISGSAIGFYGDGGERELTENSPPGQGFMADVCIAWEREAFRAREFGMRVATLRTSLVLGTEGGALSILASIFRSGFGGQIGSGRQWMSWIHLDDAAALMLFAAENDGVEGPLNLCAPHPVRNAEFTETLGDIFHRPTAVRVPKAGLRTLGEISRELLDSKRIMPQRAGDYGFVFRHPHLAGALLDLFPRRG